MKDITKNIGTLYHPKAALVVYETLNSKTENYVEYFDMDENGHPVNAHPLTVREAQRLAKALNTAKEADRAFLKPKGIIGNNMLYINASSHNGCAVWFTKASSKPLFFIDSLGIPNGRANVPALVWVASQQKLNIYAFKSNGKPTINTPLYHAPFFNVYENGNVCMGTVNVNIKQSSSLEEFTAAWENYFFNSYFSHLINGHQPVKGNCVNLWKNLVHTENSFPKEVLIKTNKTVKDLLH